MIKIVVLPTANPEQDEDDKELRGIPLEDLEQFCGEARAMIADSIDGVVKITIHGKDIRATCITDKVKRRGIGNNR